jgi:hypothetical protein
VVRYFSLSQWSGVLILRYTALLRIREKNGLGFDAASLQKYRGEACLGYSFPRPHLSELPALGLLFFLNNKIVKDIESSCFFKNSILSVGSFFAVFIGIRSLYLN